MKRTITFATVLLLSIFCLRGGYAQQTLPELQIKKTENNLGAWTEQEAIQKYGRFTGDRTYQGSPIESKSSSGVPSKNSEEAIEKIIQETKESFKRIFQHVKPNLDLPENPRTVYVSGGKLMEDFDGNGTYEPYLIKGLGYSPYPIGRYACDNGSNFYDDSNILSRDFNLLEDMNANTIRLWSAEDRRADVYSGCTVYVTDRMLDTADSYGLKVIPGFWMEWDYDYTDPDVKDAILRRFGDFVREFKDHPAILFWAIGNENNYQMSSAELDDYYQLANDMAEVAHDIEGADYRPVAIVDGELTNIGDSGYNASDADLDNIEIWGVNVYRGSSFGSFFNDFDNLSDKALWISEYGEDALSGESTQASVDLALWNQIEDAFDIQDTIGATLMAYSDEWWKAGDASRHDSNSEEYWGVMAVSDNGSNPDNMTKRQVYTDLQNRWE